MHRFAFALALGFSLLSACADAERRSLVGYVTDPGTPQRFAVNGIAIVCDPAATLAEVRSGDVVNSETACPQHLLGEKLSVSGDTDRSGGLLHAAAVETSRLQSEHIKGAALILEVLRPDAQGSVLLQADGYPLHLSQQTHLLVLTGDPPSISPFRPNLWIDYVGVLRPDGTVEVSKATLTLNGVTHAEANLRSKNEFDPSKVTEANRQQALTRQLIGLDWKRLPAYHDPALQQRVDAIGAALIPAYQRSLPASDPTKIDFRFALVDDDTYAFYPLPSGIILLSASAIKIENTDPQIAALLAEGIADVLAKTALRSRSQRHDTTALAVAGDVAGLFVPGAGLAGLTVGVSMTTVQQRNWSQQRARVSLALLSDAGYDPLAAPRASWLLAQKKGVPLSSTPMRESTQYLYETVYRVWARRSSPEAPLKLRAPARPGAPPLLP